MRILIHSAPPWAPSGYGLQAQFLARALRELGHKPAISAFGGCHEKQTWKGIPILPCGTKPYGNGVVAGNYHQWKADLLILLGDLWVMDPEQFDEALAETTARANELEDKLRREGKLIDILPKTPELPEAGDG